MSTLRTLLAGALAEQDQFVAALADLFEDETVAPQVILCVGHESLERMAWLTIEERQIVLRLAHIGLMNVLKRMVDSRELSDIDRSADE